MRIPAANICMNLLRKNTKWDENTLGRFQCKSSMVFAVTTYGIYNFEMLELLKHYSYIITTGSDNTCMPYAQGFVKASKKRVDSIVE